jgi:hypothetical protein
MHLLGVRPIALLTLVWLVIESQVCATSVGGEARRPEARRDQVPDGQGDDATKLKHLTDLLALQTSGLKLDKLRLAVDGAGRVACRGRLKTTISSRKLIEGTHEEAIPEDEASRDERLSVAEAEEQAARERLSAADAGCEAVTAKVAEDEAEIAVTQAKLKALEDPGQAAAVEASQARLSESRIKSALADESAAEAALKAAEAEVVAARKVLQAAKAHSIRMKAREAEAG